MADSLHCRSVSLIPLNSEDRALYVGLYTDPEVMTHIARPLDADRADACFNAEFGRSARNGWVWTIRFENAPVGLMALRQSAKAEEAEIGTMLKRGIRGRGVALNAIKLSIAFAFERTAWTEVVGRHHPENLGADAVMRMMRLPFERRLDEAGQQIEWRLTRAQWRAAQTIRAGSSSATVLALGAACG